MVKEPLSDSRKHRAPRPLYDARLEELALAYVARFATSAARLEAYLARKLRERGWQGETPADIPALIARFVDRGYCDDEAYARMRAGGLLRRGYGARRVNQALGVAGIADDIRDSVRPGVAQQRRAALAMARKRRFGPFAPVAPDASRREKQIAAMLRAGHELGSAMALIHADSIDAAESWVSEVEEE
ncbi:regulatory protein RecX [Caenibius tardaugens NBRC 16725]|uniref:Regulatory protein RecX n=1 Tax=Caenibius tardaugens NBRC 16725 TaxID=1219035 RepID=U2YPB1_9SPHN|nr:RecX family transcriptional regulator [Caenibius tardaugens]AZI36432.1 hypothetical protein EGO55_11115 [Caenibius tardaugens NBRC 16725]GAD50755.1 regulatory protein RecX [Caenibius tardaugens NBRC 16725]